VRTLIDRSLGTLLRCVVLATLPVLAGTAAAQSLATVRVMHAFDTDSSVGNSPLVEGRDGFLYGTRPEYDTGTAVLFRLKRDGSYQTLHVFDPNIGPSGRLVAAAGGSFYGVTRAGGASGEGSLYRFTPPDGFVELASFSGSNRRPANLMRAADGRFFGTTFATNNRKPALFRVSPDGRRISTLYVFEKDVLVHDTPPFEANDGRLYGATLYGGVNGTGSIWRWGPEGLDTLYSFGPLGSDDATSPVGRLQQRSDGALYGVSESGGNSIYGTIFRLTLDGRARVLHSFDGVDGDEPVDGLAIDAAGNLFGVTTYGGPQGYGTAFRLRADGGFDLLHDFAGAPKSQWPNDLTLAGDGRFYGSTSFGGKPDRGTLFRMKLIAPQAP
jgi:uncharacterized repeat protein (TIGR03803 family)